MRRIFEWKWWTGKGYDTNGNISFEIKNGKGYIKEYDVNGKLIFEGEYINGERNGKRKKYYRDDYENEGDGASQGYYVYEGEYLNGKKNGYGKEYYKFRSKSKLQYEGEYLNGKINGKEKYMIPLV